MTFGMTSRTPFRRALPGGHVSLPVLMKGVYERVSRISVWKSVGVVSRYAGHWFLALCSIDRLFSVYRCRGSRAYFFPQVFVGCPVTGSKSLRRPSGPSPFPKDTELCYSYSQFRRMFAFNGCEGVCLSIAVMWFRPLLTKIVKCSHTY